MDSQILESLPPLSRLALSYAPASAHQDWLTALALDARLAGVVRQAREPVLAQLKLAWWRDRLEQDVASRPRGEPLLARFAHWCCGGKAMIALVNGWEAMLDDRPFEGGAVEVFVSGRAGLAGELADRLGCNRMAAEARAQRWALAELSLHCADTAARHHLRDLALAEGPRPGTCEPAMRPLAVLEKINLRACKIGSLRALGSPAALLTAIRVGLIGR